MSTSYRVGLVRLTCDPLGAVGRASPPRLGHPAGRCTAARSPFAADEVTPEPADKCAKRRDSGEVTRSATPRRKILATRGKKNATPPCTSRRQDGIIVPRLSCPLLRRIFWLAAVNGSANGHGQLSGYSALPTASVGVRRLVGAGRLSRMCQPPAACKQRNLGEARVSARLTRGNSMTPLSVAACNSSYPRRTDSLENEPTSKSNAKTKRLC